MDDTISESTFTKPNDEAGYLVERTTIEDKTSIYDDEKTKDGANETSAAPLSTSQQVQHITDRVLHFLSHASNETLGACLVALSATTYFVLGRIGLVLIGVVSGVVLHATWEAAGHDRGDQTAAQEKESKKRKELGIEVVSRIIRWRDRKDGDEDALNDSTQIVTSAGEKKLDFSAFRPETAAALNTFTDAILRDYVKWWYAPVLPGEESFPLACRQTLTAFLLSFSNHLSRKRPVDAFLDFITNSSSIVIVFLNELAAALNASPNTTPSEAVATYLHLEPDSSLSHVLEKDHQDRKLNLVADDILRNYLDKKAFSCPPVQLFLKQILSKLILGMTIDACSKPEFINGWIVYLLEDGEPEIMNAIDAGVEQSTNANLKQVPQQLANNEIAPNAAGVPENLSPHKRHLGRAEDAMDEAMKEAQRLTQLIVEEEAKREKGRQATLSTDDLSESTTQGIVTPGSSQSDFGRNDDFEASRPSDRNEIGSIAAESKQQFTSFDQILPTQAPTALTDEIEKTTLKPTPVLTLFNATISIYDDSVPGDKSFIRTKPTTEYLIQLEPASSSFSGWMITRKYADFETLHEVLRRISVITGTGFAKAHSTLPNWKTHTKDSLRGELERYLSDAVRFQPLAESEGMKRFLEKEQGLARSPSGGTGKAFGWPTPAAFDQMGKNMMDVLTKAPKDVAGGGKAIFGGVTNVFSGKKNPASSANSPSNRSSLSLAPMHLEDSYMGSITYERDSQEVTRSAVTPAPRTTNAAKAVLSLDTKPRPSLSSRSSIYGRPSGEGSPSSSLALVSPATGPEENLNLPPPPSDIPDDYNSPKHVLKQPARVSEDMTYRATSGNFVPSPLTGTPRSKLPETPVRNKAEPDKTPAKPTSKPPITEQETQVAVELMFAVITELYNMSSAWNFRRTLLNAAKTFLLRPGNPQLEAIRVLIQESVLDTNTSDAGIAAHILKIRENSLPTEDELGKWPAPPSDKEKEDLRIKARKLLVERGMPQALTSVMGAAASGEALGKVFDCLQIDTVARGLVFGLVLQGLGAVVQ